MCTLKRTLSWILFLFLLETLLIACNCPEPSSFRYANERLTILNLDNTGSEARLSGLDSVNKNAYGIRVNMSRILIAIQQDRCLGNIAYASSRNCLTEYYPANAIETIKIITLYDFDASHRAGADLTAYFKKVDFGKFYDIETMYGKQSQTFLADFLKSLEADILLIKAPEAAGMHTFVVEARLSDGTQLSDTTSVKLY